MMMREGLTVEIEYYKLPVHWAPAFVNGDLTGYDSDDLRGIRLFTQGICVRYHAGRLTMAFAASNKPVSGRFIHKETCRPFEFVNALDVLQVVGKGGKLEMFPQLVYVGPLGDETRMARVLKTVAYVIVDETDDGKLVVEKWPIKKLTVYR